MLASQGLPRANDDDVGAAPRRSTRSSCADDADARSCAPSDDDDPFWRPSRAQPNRPSMRAPGADDADAVPPKGRADDGDELPPSRRADDGAESRPSFSRADAAELQLREPCADDGAWEQPFWSGVCVVWPCLISPVLERLLTADALQSTRGLYATSGCAEWTGSAGGAAERHCDFVAVR